VKILVTGREGQVARSLARNGLGSDLVFTGRPELDLADAASIERAVAAVAPDLIISAAALTAVDAAEDEPALAMAVNGEGPGVLARCAARIDAPIIHISTDYVFDGGLGRPWREDDPTGPIGVYGATKLAGEDAVATSGATYVIVRTAWVYSPYGNNFVKTMLRLAQSRAVVNVVEDQIGCPTSAFDIADGIEAIVEAWRCDPRHGAGEIYHLGGADAMSWADFARLIFGESELRGGPTATVSGIATSAYPTRARRPSNSRLDSGKFATRFAYRANGPATALPPVLNAIMSEPFDGTTRPSRGA
jgi:dTDP-4-dehydrorhamnose reductase